MALLAALTGTAGVRSRANPEIIATANDLSQWTHCGQDKTMFNASVGSTGKIVSVCQHLGASAAQSGLIYRYGKPGHIEMAYPAERASYAPFTLRIYTRPRTTYMKFEFTNGGFQYAILEAFEADEAIKDTASLKVTRLSDGKVIFEQPLSPTTEPLTLMAVEDLVTNAPFDE